MPKNNPAAYLPVAGGLVDTIVGGIMQGAANKKNRKFALQMYERQRADSLADWNMQNLYDSPAAQMARLKEAGLNPHLMYGGSGSVAQSATIRSADMGKYDAGPLPGTQLGPTLSQYYNIKLQNAQTDNVEAQTEVAKTEAFLKTIQGIKTAFEGEHSRFDLERKEELKRIIFEQGVANLDFTKAQIDASVHGNQRAQELQKGNLTGQRLDNARKALDNAMQQMQNRQFEQLRPLQLEQLRATIEQIKQQTTFTLQSEKNEFQRTRLNKMDADAGKILQWINAIRGGKR